MTEKKFKKVCQCHNCGNEAEMMFTCTLAPEEEEVQVPPTPASKQEKKKTKAHGVCSHCGNEADMWIDL